MYSDPILGCRRRRTGGQTAHNFWLSDLSDTRATGNYRTRGARNGRIHSICERAGRVRLAAEEPWLGREDGVVACIDTVLGSNVFSLFLICILQLVMGCSLTWNSAIWLQFTRTSDQSVAGLTSAVVNHRVIYFNTQLWFPHCHGSPGVAAGEHHFIHIVYITLQTTRCNVG